MYIAAIHMLFWLFGFFGRVLWHIVFWFWSFFVSWKCKQQLHLQIIILVVKNITLVDVYDKHAYSFIVWNAFLFGHFGCKEHDLGSCIWHAIFGLLSFLGCLFCKHDIELGSKIDIEFV